MKTKLTLSAKDSITKKAKSSPKLRRLAGVVKLPVDFDEKKELNAYFESKHL